MIILYISQYFHPELGATTNRSTAVIKAMRNAGHQVTVLSEMPNHPQGVIFPEYRGRFLVKEFFNDIPVYHLPVIASPQKNFITRIMMYLSFSVSAMLFILIKQPKYDLLYVTSPPLFSALCAILSKTIFLKRKLVFEIRDLWPDSAIELGELKSAKLINASLYLEKLVYSKSDLLVCATNYINSSINRKGISSDKLFTSFNGVDDIILSTYTDKPFDSNQSSFTAIFTGNMGVILNLETIIHCAKLMVSEPIHFIFVGGGPSMGSLQSLTKRLNLTNVEFVSQVPQIELCVLLSKADFGMVVLKDIPISNGVLPVKIYDYMAYKLPIVAGLKGEAADIINEAEAGIVVAPEDETAMVKAFRTLMEDAKMRESMGNNARSYVLQHFRRSQLADELVAEISSRFSIQ